MLELVSRLFEELNEREIRYCHWKSNESLGDALEGRGDLDILVDRRDAGVFAAILENMGFKKAVDLGEKRPDSISHYYGMDLASGNIVHLHVYFRIVTGGALFKNYRFPLEEMLLDSVESMQGVKVPSKPAEFALLVMRKAIEHGSLLETLFFYKEYDRIRRELIWLGGEDVIKESVGLIEHWLPSIDKVLFTGCARELMPGGSFFKRLLLGKKLRMRLHNYSIYGPLKACLMTISSMASRISRRISGRKVRVLARGGAVVAIVGAEAVGKSTIQRELKKWLGDFFWVEAVHVGKPPSTVLTFLPNLMMPFVRKSFAGYRSSHVKSDIRNTEKGKKKDIGMLRFGIFAIRSLMVALDREDLIRKIWRKASRGAVVLCDRYPSYEQGAMDSSQFEGLEEYFPASRLGKVLAGHEKQIYRSLPAPDVVFCLTVAVETALTRNVARGKAGIEGDEYVRSRHASSVHQTYTTGCEYVIDTSSSLETTLSKVKAMLWGCI